MSYHPKYCTLLYGVSCLLDAVDGQAARALEQTSKFGAVLDMVTDRYVPSGYDVRDADELVDVQPLACSATFRLPIHSGRSSSNF